MVVALTVALAGCGGGGGTATPAEGGDGAASDGNADESDDSDGSDGSDGDAAPTATAETGETAASTPTATQMAAGTQTPTPTPTPNASVLGTDESADPLLEDLLQSPDAYRYRVETNTEQGTYVQVGRWYEEDYYGRVESGSVDQQVEVYRVDGEVVTVFDGQCMAMDAQQVQNPENATNEGSQNLSVRPVGTDTIEGESVYVYEVETGQRIGTVTYYVDTETGYPRKMEFMQTTIEYWDFGSVEPIEAPC
jgi:hypothetical protein